MDLKLPVSFYEKVLDSVNEGIWVADGQDNIFYSNKGAETLLQIEEDVLINTNVLADLYPAQSKTFTAYFQSAKKSLKPVEFVAETRDIHGEIRYHKGWLFPQTESGIYNGMICTFRDVTERRLAERALLKSEKSYRLMADNISDVIWTIDFETKQFTYISPSVYKMRGFTVEEALSEPVEESLVKEDVANIMKILNSSPEELLKTYDINGIHIFKVRQRTKDGRVIWVEISASLILNEHGKPVEIVGASRDITDRKETEQALRDSEERYRVLSDETPVAIFITEKGICIDANAAASRLFGYTREEFVGMHATKIVSKDSEDTMMRYIMEGVETMYDAITIDKFGNKIPVSFQGKMLTYKGKKTRLTLCYDRRDQIKREKELQDFNVRLTLAAKSALIGIFEWNTTTNHLQWDNRMFELYDVDLKTTATYDIWAEKIHPVDFPKVQTALDRCLKKGTNFDPEFRIIHQNGDIRYIKAHALLVDDKETNTERLIGVNYDITERHQIERDLIEAKNNAEESDRLKSAFLSNMSHEIRTPMNSILGFSEILREEPDMDHEQRAHFLNIISNSGNQLLDIVNDILDISKIEAGETKLSLKPTLLKDTCLNVFSSFSVVLKEKHIDWNIEIQDELKELRFMCDQVKTKQVITNLISNAIKFTHSGHINLHISKHAHMLLFKIEDTGIGIPEALLTKIFDRFRQVETQGARKYGGTGLGLAICKSLVTLMGGEIWVESELEKGSTFFFTLPLNFNYELPFE